MKLNYSVPLDMITKFSNTTQAVRKWVYLCFFLRFSINKEYLRYYLQWLSHLYPVESRVT